MNENPVVKLNDVIEVEWPLVNDTYHAFKCKILSISKCNHLKKRSRFKYELLFEDGDIKRTRLANLKWKQYQSLPRMKLILKPGLNLDFRYILAPMVGGSELAFRVLCRKYGVTLAYTPMMSSEKFVIDSSYRSSEFQTTDFDRPLVAHFSGNNPDVMLEAAKFVENKCDAIDLNLGCPQRVAHAGHFGSFLLDKEDRPLVLSIVRKLSQNLSIPIFVKIRLLDSIDDTIELVNQLASAGASLVAIHARYRVNLVGRTGPGARDGLAHLDQVAEIKKAVPNIVIISNGNTRTWEDVMENLQLTGADGLMSAEGLLDDPTLFAPSYQQPPSSPLSHTPSHPPLSPIQSASHRPPAPVTDSSDRLAVAQEYLELARLYPVKLKSIIFHIRRICKQELTQYQLLDDCINGTSLEQIQAIIQQAISYQVNNNFVFDAHKAKREKDCLQRKKFEEGKRKLFEERMIRKAKREGKALDYYLQQGLDAPTVEELEELRAMSKEKSFEIWKSRFMQHCYAYHFDKTNGCGRDRSCAFLHVDSNTSELLQYG